MTRAQIRRICAEGAKYFIEDPELNTRGVCDYLSSKISPSLMYKFEELMSPNLEEFCEGIILRTFWLQERREHKWDPSCRERRAMALLLFAEAVDLKELK